MFSFWPTLAALIFLALFPPGNVLPQDNIDSLRQIVILEPDTREKADHLYELMRGHYLSGSYDSAWSYSERLFPLATMLGYPERAADALYIRCLIRDKQGRINEIMPMARQYLQLIKPLDDTIRLGKGHIIYSRVLKDQGYHDSAFYYLKENLKMGRALPDTLMILVTLNDLGNYYQDLNMYDSAMVYYLEAGRLCESAGMTHHLGNIYNNLGKTFWRMKQYDEATRYLETSMKINRERNDLRNVALNLTNLGMISLEKDQLDQALDYYKQAFDIYVEFGPELLEIADLYNNIAEVYEQQEKYAAALENLKKASAIYSKQNYIEGITISLMNMGNIYNARDQYESARMVLDSSLEVAVRAGSVSNQKSILWALADNYYDMGDYARAYDYYDRYHEKYAELFEIERTNKINEWNIKYNNERIARENLGLKNDNLEIQLQLRKKSMQSTVFMFTFIGVVLLALLIALYSRYRITVSRSRILKLEEEKKLIGARLLLEAQEQERKRIALELHDGLGVLLSATRIQFSNLKDESPSNRKVIEKATQLLEQASGDVRKISHNMMPGLLTKLGLYEAVEDLFENLNDTEGMNAVCEITGKPDRLPENKEIMLYRIIQEWVNNTLKHARARNILMKLLPVNGMLQIDYSDDGAGFEPSSVFSTDTESLGLKSIRSRVSFLNGSWSIDSAPGKGVHYRLNIPM